MPVTESISANAFAGLAIYNAIKRHPAKTNVYIDGVAASIASVIAMASDKVFIADSAMMMLHNPWAMTGGDANELRKSADLLDKIRDQMLGIYASRMKWSRPQILEAVNAETWLDAQEADIVYNDIIIANPDMSDGVAPFHNGSHSNDPTGAALSNTSLGAARYLLIPAALEQIALELTEAVRVTESGTEIDQLQWIKNLVVMVELRLDADSTTAWYLIADSMQVDTVEAAHLGDNETVEVIEEQGFDIARLRIRATLDFAAKAIDWRGMLRNEGS